MQEAIGAYRHVAATDEFREIERLRSLARHNEASALSHARSMGKIEGKIEGTIETVVAFLEARFGRIPGSLRAKLLNVRDDSAMEAAVKRAATCHDLAEFQEQL